MNWETLVIRIGTLHADAEHTKLNGTITVSYENGRAVSISKNSTERLVVEDARPKVEKR